MKRIAIIAITCMLGLVLTACGENYGPKPSVNKNHNTTTTHTTPTNSTDTNHTDTTPHH